MSDLTTCPAVESVIDDLTPETLAGAARDIAYLKEILGLSSVRQVAQFAHDTVALVEFTCRRRDEMARELAGASS